jgi:hypothetical protein
MIKPPEKKSEKPKETMRQIYKRAERRFFAMDEKGWTTWDCFDKEMFIGSVTIKNNSDLFKDEEKINFFIFY